ncbi:N-acetylmuramoyl-L-alanine amidase [Lactobacillus delbrueckii subsp. delbrueckii DSM 20074 = JCM 1012]|uniref:SLAP domain-containing protein n=1 Tax=Lactobacillus delbrueckii TaxID=1584 RepID=UPI00046EB3F1|nr:SLAP domain-containing protein [Lactobacillus delbrueckii]APP10098.1 N-acetylmuramoyl-L-alanine amidase [Lactobacillus delbrueckii subsp. delbrueckii DSM 20074 = JCM 1012]KNZ37757.1 N-acetylmuramoyl-L-alanine amidase [Lactobacillus delbrueckii subsp. delbrueckii]KRK27221.1 N-acetylmuramoyl-L-alanine amidase [Lactobacillus delbrueckii subsp. delbrueckii DSM 20074 = JCM 1012]MCT3492842.1 N-acetylmuramoyl-L-alanine amidase [Lactobacillus delbrueckii]MCT3522547.1 N-acetylmuramoyl-L-alanine amid
MHSSAVYSKNLKKTTYSVAEGKKILTFGRTTIKNKKYYQTDYNSFISASNVDGMTRTLKQTYGSAVSIKGKKYYIIGVGKYVTKSDFKQNANKLIAVRNAGPLRTCILVFL